MIGFKIQSFALLILSFLLLTACSTKKNTFATRSYHNITSKYNGYFYAKENLKAGKQKIEKSYKDNYTQLLPLYINGDSKAAKSVYPEMDKAIEKASNVIQRHSIYIKKKEYCRWIDDCYLLIGKASFYKKDFSKANEMMSYVAKEFKDEDIRYDAKLWLYKLYVEEKKYEKADHIYALIIEEAEIPKKVLLEAKKIKAHMFLENNEEDRAIELVKEVIDDTKKKRDKARLAYILAQIYQEKNNFFMAADYYNEVIKYNPPYEMAFNAKLNLAMCSMGDSDDFDKVINPLKKMLDDEKNKEYRDKIYFVLAELYKEQNDIPAAIQHYRLSVSSSVNDNNQKAISYLAIGDIFFERPNYPQAKSYYDSTLTVLSKEYPRYEEVFIRRNNLKGLVYNLNIISNEDSLLAFAEMSERERNKIIKELIKEAEEDERLAKEQAEIEKQEKVLMRENTRSSSGRPRPGGGGSSWYFYNTSVMSFGIAEFKTKWGDRKLEDNWRRSLKTTLDGGEFAEFDEEEELVNEYALEGDLKNMSTYLKNVPFSDKQKAASEERIVEAYFELGRIYEEDFGERKKAIISYEYLIKNYKGCKLEDGVMYYLYKLYDLNKRESTSNYYKKRLLQEYPNSDYAAVVRNPNYAEEVRKEADKILTLYEYTYESFNSGQYKRVQSNYLVASNDYKGNKLMPKFEYLNALAKSKTERNEAKLKERLNKLISTYPQDSVADLAKKVIAYLDTEREEQISEEAEEVPSIYKEINENDVHYVVLIINAEKTDLNTFKNNLSDFNKKYFRTKKFTLKTIPIKKDLTMITVKWFKKAAPAMEYYETLADNNTFIDLSIGQRMLIIWKSNYIRFYKDQDVDKYESFMVRAYFD
ncbi:MAG: tetratricopeptide repeat protein [Flavobacteriales bacterium]|nr:tetratricopeptide repeat protein [Flavobacteriales bacterium]